MLEQLEEYAGAFTSLQEQLIDFIAVYVLGLELMSFVMQHSPAGVTDSHEPIWDSGLDQKAMT